MKKGDLIWQMRMPGGYCTLVEVFDCEKMYDETDHGWTDTCWPIYRVLHSTEGMIDDPSYYYTTLQEQEIFERVHLRYRLKSAGIEVPEWLQNEITKDENR